MEKYDSIALRTDSSYPMVCEICKKRVQLLLVTNPKDVYDKYSSISTLFELFMANHIYFICDMCSHKIDINTRYFCNRVTTKCQICECLTYDTVTYGFDPQFCICLGCEVLVRNLKNIYLVYSHGITEIYLLNNFKYQSYVSKFMWWPTIVDRPLKIFDLTDILNSTYYHKNWIYLKTNDITIRALQKVHRPRDFVHQHISKKALPMKIPTAKIPSIVCYSSSLSDTTCLLQLHKHSLLWNYTQSSNKTKHYESSLMAVKECDELSNDSSDTPSCTCAVYEQLENATDSSQTSIEFDN